MNDPLPVYSTKTYLQELCTPEIFVVMIIRLHAAAERDPSGAHVDWRQGMAAAGVTLEGADGFDNFMQLLTVIVRWPLDVRSMHCRCLGEGEAWLLQVISLLQHDSYSAAEQILGRWLPPGVARIAVQHMHSFAHSLTSTRLVVPLRYCETALLNTAAHTSAFHALAALH
jgi:hypothetical protein